MQIRCLQIKIRPRLPFNLRKGLGRIQSFVFYMQYLWDGDMIKIYWGLQISVLNKVQRSQKSFFFSFSFFPKKTSVQLALLTPSQPFDHGAIGHVKCGLERLLYSKSQMNVVT